MKVLVVKQSKNLQRARHDLGPCNLLENRTGNDLVLEYKDSQGRMWELNARSVIDIGELPKELCSKLKVRYSVAHFTNNGWAMVHGPFLDLNDALSITPDNEDSVILLQKGDVSDHPIYGYDVGQEMWKKL